MSLYGALGEAVRRDEVVYRGEVALDGSNPTTVETGLKSISAVFINQKLAVAPALGASVFTYDTTGGTLDIYAWEPTGAGDTTLVASTDTDTVSFIVIGELHK